MKKEIMKLVQATGGSVSFAEMQHLDGFHGELCYCLPTLPTIVLWANMSEAAARAIDGLLREGFLDVQQTTSLTYMIDGTVLKLPVAKQLRAYKNDRWLPVTFSPTSKVWEEQ